MGQNFFLKIRFFLNLHTFQNNSNANGNQIPCPWLELSTNLWKTLSTTLEHYQSELRVVEHCCRAVRFIIRSMGIQSVVFVEELAHQVGNILKICIYKKDPPCIR